MMTPAAIEETLFSSDVVRVGTVRLPAAHPAFETFSAPTENYAFAFPRNPVAVEPDGRPPFIADQNTIPLHNAGRAYRRRSVRGGDDRCEWFAVAPHVLREIVAGYDGRAADGEWPFRFAWSRPDARAYLTQRRIYRYLRDCDRPDPLYVEEAVVHLATAIVDAAYRQAMPAGDAEDGARRRLVERTRERLAASFTHNVSLGTLAREVGASVFHLCRVFKAQTGLTIHQYRTQLRVRHSLEVLEKEPGDILSAALELGFSGHSHYTRTFHALFGVPPSDFTNEVRARARRPKDGRAAPASTPRA